MNQPIPQGIEVLVRKASVDPAFKMLLLERRTAAAEQIGLELSAAEAAMLQAVPAAQLEAMIAHTTVPDEHRRAFLGQAAAAMLAAAGMISTAMAIEPPKLQAPGGVRPPSPNPAPTKEPTVQERVIEVVAKQFGVEKKQVTRQTSLAKNLHADAAGVRKLKTSLEKAFDVVIPDVAFNKIESVGGVVTQVERSLMAKKQPATAPVQTVPSPQPGTSRGVRPDRPPAGGLGGMRPE
jgi:acyl carrier protein